MKRQEILQKIDTAFLDKLYGFCYKRCSTSADAQELCSEILLEYVKAAAKEGNVEAPEGFLWQIAHHVYADFSHRRKAEAERFAIQDPEELLSRLVVPSMEPADREDRMLLQRIYREIAFLSEIYRNTMIWYYLDGASTFEIAKRLSITENAVRQRLFHARNIVRKEVKNMTVSNKPITLQEVEYTLWGTGRPSWGDPRETCHRQLSKHMMWLCRNKERTAKEISDELHIPMMYAEEELACLVHGMNGKYGVLRKTEQGKYITNIILLSDQEIQEIQQIYLQRIPMICQVTADYLEAHKEELMSEPYLNHQVDWNLILWKHIATISYQFGTTVSDLLAQKYCKDVPSHNRPFSIFGFLQYDGMTSYGGGWDGINANNICGYKRIHLDNIYVTRIKKHFSCGHDIANDHQLQLAIRAIDGLAIDTLSEAEKEVAAKAIDCGYLMKEEQTIYTKILVSEMNGINKQKFADLKEIYRAEAEIVAEAIYQAMIKMLPPELYPDYKLFNSLASLPVEDTLIEALIDRKMLIPPKDGIGAEGCWMYVEK